MQQNIEMLSGLTMSFYRKLKCARILVLHAGALFDSMPSHSLEVI